MNTIFEFDEKYTFLWIIPSCQCQSYRSTSTKSGTNMTTSQQQLQCRFYAFGTNKSCTYLIVCPFFAKNIKLLSEHNSNARNDGVKRRGVHWHHREHNNNNNSITRGEVIKNSNKNNQTAMPGTKSWWQFEKKKQQCFDPQEAQRACGRKHGGDQSHSYSSFTTKLNWYRYETEFAI